MKIIGAGWVSATATGAVCKRRQKEYSGELRQALKAEGFLTERIKNAGKFDASTHRAFCATALALHDADFVASGDSVALIGTGSEECTQSNRTYFKDYVGHGRQLARANLFIYTLPTSPLAEIAIYFKLGGPLFYTESLSNQGANLLHSAERLIDENSASSVLAIWMEQDLTAAFLLKKGSTELPEADHPSRWIQFLEETL